MIHNIVIGHPLVDLHHLLALNVDDWALNEFHQTHCTMERNLPAALKEAGIVPSISEVRRNKPELMVTLDKPDCFWVKWGKKRVYVVVGE